MSTKCKNLAIIAFIYIQCWTTVGGRSLTMKETVAHHFKLTDDFARTLKNLTSQRLTSSQQQSGVKRCNRKTTRITVEKHFRLLHNILSNANLELLERELEIATSNLKINVNHLSASNGVPTWSITSSKALSLKCLHTISRYAEYLVRWKKFSRMRKEKCTLLPTNYVCERLLSSCGCQF